MHFESVQNAGTVAQSPKFSIALRRYSTDLKHKIEADKLHFRFAQNVGNNFTEFSLFLTFATRGGGALHSVSSA